MSADRPIAFVCAMPMELRPLRRRLRLRPGTGDRRTISTGALDGHEVVAVVTGMGTALATAGATQLLDAVRPALVVVVGITGAVDDETPIGTLMAPAWVVDAATGRRHAHHPVLPGPVSGTMWTTDRITTATELPALRAQGVTCLDMETAAVAEVCEQREVPWTVVRAISDRASDGSVDEEVFHLSRQDGRPDPGAVLRYVVRHPGRVPGLARMGRGARSATVRAAAAAIEAARVSLRGS